MKSETPVVALHSLFFSGAMFDELAKRSPGRLIVAPTHRGQDSFIDTDLPPTLEQLAIDTIEVLNGFDQAVHLVGSSMGAYVAAIVAARAPNLVRSCVLSAATGNAERRPELFQDLEDRLRTVGPTAMLHDIERTMFGDVFLRSGGAQLDRWRRHFAALDHRVADAAHEVFARPELWQQLEAIRCPVLLLAGRLDRAKSPAEMEEIAARIGCSSPVVFEGSGHTPFVEEAASVAEVLNVWWDSFKRT
jgi:3-oxoadipate enol-lactonase